MLEQARKLCAGSILTYGETLVGARRPWCPQDQVCCRLPGTDGKAKMRQISGQLHLPVQHRG